MDRQRRSTLIVRRDGITGIAATLNHLPRLLGWCPVRELAEVSVANHECLEGAVLATQLEPFGNFSSLVACRGAGDRSSCVGLKRPPDGFKACCGGPLADRPNFQFQLSSHHVSSVP